MFIPEEVQQRAPNIKHFAVHVAGSGIINTQGHGRDTVNAVCFRIHANLPGHAGVARSNYSCHLLVQEFWCVGLRCDLDDAACYRNLKC